MNDWWQILGEIFDIFYDELEQTLVQSAMTLILLIPFIVIFLVIFLVMWFFVHMTIFDAVAKKWFRWIGVVCLMIVFAVVFAVLINGIMSSIDAWKNLHWYGLIIIFVTLFALMMIDIIRDRYY